jgi:hypothetical protein
MDAEELVTTVKEARQSELDRLGSDRRLLALTGADLTEAQVLSAATLAERAAMETFRVWAEGTPNQQLTASFRSVADTESNHFDRLQTERDGSAVPDSEAGALHEFLRGLSDAPAQVGAGLIGRPLVGDRTQLQFVNFFLNEADRSRADLFRSLRADTQEQLAVGRELLPTVCRTAAEWDRAREAALEAIDIAYAEYAEELNELGINPKSIC